MRVLPPAWENLHPAFVAPDPPFSCSPAIGPTSLFAGLVGAGFLAGSHILGRPAAWGLSIKIAAYSSIGFTTLAVPSEVAKHVQARAFLSQHGIQMPERKSFDRLGYFDEDDAAIAGALAGLFLASRVPHPWSIYGWKRWVGTAVYGSFVSQMAFNIYHLQSGKLEQVTSRLRERTKESAKWQPQVKAAWANATRSAKNLSAGSTKSPEKVTDKPVMAMLKDMEQPTPVLSMTTQSTPASEKIGFDKTSWSNMTNDPHLTSSKSDSQDPVPYANTNYLWTPTHGHEIDELKAHISKLRHRRQELADEAEHLWYWLAQKEADYYNMATDSPDSNEKVRKRRYLEALGNVQTKIWVEVSKLDWMIMDSNKQIEQFRSAKAHENGNVTWLPSLSNQAASAEPQESKSLLKSYLQQNKKRAADVQNARQDMAVQMAKPDLKFKDGKFQSPFDGRWASAKEIQFELMKRVEEEYENAKLDEEALEEVVRDAEQKVKEARQRGG